MKDEMMAKIMDEVMKKMGGTDAPAQSMACEAPQGINEDLCRVCWNSYGTHNRFSNC